MISTLEPINIVLVNLYFIMVLQLALNWQDADCNTHSNFFQLVFIVTMVARILTQEAFLNKNISKKQFRAITLFTSGFFLTGIAVYEAITLSRHGNEFDYDPNSKQGSLNCYQNRIVYVAEIAICFLTVIKDIAVIIMSNEGREGKEESI